MKKTNNEENVYLLKKPSSKSLPSTTKMDSLFPRDACILKKIYITLKSCCLSSLLIISLVILTISLIALVFKSPSREINIVLIQTGAPLIYTTDTKFLSVALDSSLIADNFKNFNFTNPRLQKMMSFLAPGYLRLGGTMADRLWFQTNSNQGVFKIGVPIDMDSGTCSEEHLDCDPMLRPNFTMSAKEWLKINQLANAVGLTIIFDVNCLIRHDNGSWNSRNAESLIAFSDKHGLDVMWELGNEPNAFRHVFGYSVNASQLARDFISLRTILNRYPSYNQSLLVGPDTTRPQPHHKESEVYLKAFLESGGKIVDAVTWHQYYFNGRTATLSDFLNTDIFDILKNQIETVQEIVQSVSINNLTKPIWLGETSSAYGGGSPLYSNTFISTFIWLDKLGLAARSGIDLVIRQSLFKGNYALIDDNLFPRPDWWVSVIYKLLISPEVIPCFTASSPLVRLYCHCTKFATWNDSTPSVTVFGFNLKNVNSFVRVEFDVEMMESTTDRPIENPRTVLSYVLEANNSNLISKYITLNGEILSLPEEGHFPKMKPNVTSTLPYLIMPPRSLAFWIVSHPALRYCGEKKSD